MENNNIKFAFFGSDFLSVGTLNKLKEKGFLPDVLVTMPDRPKGRGLKLQQTKVGKWAEENKIKTIKQKDLKNIPEELEDSFDIFVVVSFGMIIPKDILEIPRYGVLNLHPSLLPKYRGPSPMIETILNKDDKTGVSIILLDEEMDHGPIVMQQEIKLNGQENYEILRDKSAEIGGEMLSEIFKDLKNFIKSAKPQNDSLATYTKLVKKEDGLLNLKDPIGSYRKFLAFSIWPGTYFFAETKKGRLRVKVTSAHLDSNEFIIDCVIPEGKREMTYSDFKKIFSA